MTDSTYPAPNPHLPIRELFPDVFAVSSSIEVRPFVRVNRNMVIVRDGNDLTLINPVRLSVEGEADLSKLGNIKNIVRLGCFHGMDDRYYVEQLGATFWVQEKSNYYKDPEAQHVLREGGELPISGATLFTFRDTKRPEAVLLLNKLGLLITCDSFQHYANRKEMSLLAILMLPFLGFVVGRVMIGPIWLKYMVKEDVSLESDFKRILELDFKHLISAHGQLRRDDAHESAEAEVAKVFPKG